MADHKMWFILEIVHDLGIKRRETMVRENIEAERWRLHMTKTDMCNELGVTLKTYNTYIRGAMIPSTVLEQLRRLTGKPIDYLLGLDNGKVN